MARHNGRMMCDPYERLRENYRVALQQWSRAVCTPKWTLEAAHRFQVVHAEREDAMKLLGRHNGAGPLRHMSGSFICGPGE
jgi:hypothetical protein